MTVIKNALFKRVERSLAKRRDVRQAVLGNGMGQVDVPATTDKVYVRFVEGVDANGLTVYSAPTPVEVGDRPYIVADGAGVLVGRDWRGKLAVVGADTGWFEAQGLSPRILNPNHPSARFVTLDQISLALVRPVGTVNTPSTLVSCHQLFYYDDDGDLRFFEGDQIDLGPYVPGAGNHRVACVGLSTQTNALTVVASTPQPIATTIDKTDYDEAIEAFEDDVIPLQGFILRDAQTALDARNVGLDLRNIINTPRYEGFPNPIEKHVRIRASRQVVASDLEIVGTLDVIGELVLV